MRNAFTLLELLVSIALVAILAALVMPAMSAVKIANSRALSAHSLLNLGLAGRSYLNDHDNYFWRYSQQGDDGRTWWFGWESNSSLSKPEGQRTLDYSRGPLGPYAISSDNVPSDPAFMAYSPRLKPKYQNGNYGYGYNTYLDPNYPNPISAKPTRNALQAQNPGQVLLFATCANVNTMQAPASSAKPMIEEFYIINEVEVTAHFRHGGKALAVFLDGSVREMEMAPGTQDMRMPSANIGRFAPKGDTKYLW